MIVESKASSLQGPVLLRDLARARWLAARQPGVRAWVRRLSPAMAWQQRHRSQRCLGFGAPVDVHCRRSNRQPFWIANGGAFGANQFDAHTSRARCIAGGHQFNARAAVFVGGHFGGAFTLFAKAGIRCRR